MTPDEHPTDRVAVAILSAQDELEKALEMPMREKIQQEAAHPVTEDDGEHHLDRGAKQGDASHGCELPQ